MFYHNNNNTIISKYNKHKNDCNRLLASDFGTVPCEYRMQIEISLSKRGDYWKIKTGEESL